MKAFSIASVLLSLSLPVIVAAPQAQHSVAAITASAPEPCIQVAAMSVWNNRGFNHIVYLTNLCQETFDCTVSTNVTPEPQQTSVPPSMTVAVVTAVDSMERGFVPIVSCEPQPTP